MKAVALYVFSVLLLCGYFLDVLVRAVFSGRRDPEIRDFLEE